ncbi:MAG: PadR family transcriptional regulator [Gemmatimonadetes bacterium]|nr:PadR family transcriptional regulator [Gemmatimonadota bacterium]
MATSEPDTVSSHLPLHPLELRILLVLAGEGAAHGYRIVKAIEDRDGTVLRIFPANLYRRIRDLSARGLLEEAPVPPDEAQADPRRRYFRLTDLGRAVARADAARLAGLVQHARKVDILEPA